MHHQTAALALTGTVTLDAEGNPDAIFIFQTDAAFDTAAGSSVILANGAQAANVYWVVVGAAGTGAGTTMCGTIMARGAITLGAGTALTGRALSRGAVTLARNTITNPGPFAFDRAAVASMVGNGPTATAEVNGPASVGESAPASMDETAPAPMVEPLPTVVEKTAAAPSGTAAETSPEKAPESAPDSTSALAAPPVETGSSVRPAQPEPGPTTGDTMPARATAP